jgi:16S rRNA (cytidine1402-2'-O)-methyltransferase
MLEVLGDRPAAVGRELTKVFEEITRGTLSAAHERYRDKKVKGELTIAVAGLAGGAQTKAEDGETSMGEASDRDERDDEYPDEDKDSLTS